MISCSEMLMLDDTLLKLDKEDLAGIEAAYYALCFRRFHEMERGQEGSFWEVKRGSPGTGYLALLGLENILERAGRLPPKKRLTNRYYQFTEPLQRERLTQLKSWPKNKQV